jgi:tRNA pseudouridine(55) synthase
MYTVYKPIGKTPYEVVQQFKRDKGLIGTVAYSGRLDPMAHGLLLLLTGDELKRMDEYNKKNKRYRFKVLVGVSTDTTDVLGVIKDSKKGSIDEIIQTAAHFDGKEYDQEYHLFSSMTVSCNIDGKTKKVPMWRVFKDPTIDTTQIVIPTKRVTIHSLSFTEVYKMDKEELIKFIDNNLDQITDGQNFRLDKVKESWSDYFAELSNVTFDILVFDSFVSSGTYIRQLVKDISIKCGIPLTVVEIYRYDFEL